MIASHTSGLCDNDINMYRILSTNSRHNICIIMRYLKFMVDIQYNWSKIECHALKNILCEVQYPK